MFPGKKCDPLDWVALNLLPLTPLQRCRAVTAWGTPRAAAHDIPAERLVPGRPLSAETGAKIRRIRRRLRRAAEAELRRARRAGLTIVTPASEDYPAELLEIADPPGVLYVRGRLAQPQVRVAIVGSRHPTLYGRRVATGTAETLAGRGVTVVSGGARGIDTAAHRGALTGGGPTVVVLGSGFARPYPADNEELFERVAESGAVVSEFPLDAGPRRHHFPQRNRLISGLCAALVVVEAAKGSGSLITADFAVQQGRELFAVPGPVTSEMSAGTNALIRDGVRPLLDTDDLLAELPPMYREALPTKKSRSGRKTRPALTDDERAVLSLLDPVEPVHIDILADRWPEGIARLQAALFGLLLKEAVEETPGRYYVCRPLS